MLQPSLFPEKSNEKSKEQIELGAMVLRGFALSIEKTFLNILEDITSQSPFRHMITPGGFRMSAAMTNCGTYGWVTDKNGYRYDFADPITGNAWPKMPDAFLELAINAAVEAGFKNFIPDSCLINRYQPGAKLSLHQDKDEKDLDAPIVSVSLGLPAIFLFGGLKRSDKPKRITLLHGDVVVWGDLARLNYHGIMPLKEGAQDLLGPYRYNLTFRKAR